MLVETVSSTGLYFLAGLIMLGFLIYAYLIDNKILMLVFLFGAASVFMAPVIIGEDASFRVIILEENEGEVQIIENIDFRGGKYIAPSGEEVSILREEIWGSNRQMIMKQPTLILNRTSRLITLKTFSYSISGYGPDSATMPIFPNDQISTPIYIYAIEPEGYIPPKEINSNFATDETLVVALYSSTPYSVDIHGDRETLTASGERWTYDPQ